MEMTMSKTVDLTLLNARLAEKETTIQKARFFEEMEMRGDTKESITKDAKTFLSLGEDDSVTLEAANIVKNYNVQAKAFLELVNFRVKAEETGLITSEEKGIIENIEKRVAETMSKRYDIHVEDLYVEDEE
jgi:hypothetical protein